MTLSPFGHDDLDAAAALSRAEGWPHTRNDWSLLASVAEGVAIRDGRTLKGTALWVPYGPRVASVCMVMVDPSVRRRGLGRRLMDRVLADTAGRSLRLVATPSGQPLYQALGFEESGRVHKLEGAPSLAALGPRNGVVLARESDMPAILALDAAAYGADRGRLLAALMDAGDAMILRDPFVTGYAVRRPFGPGVVIGPVVAPSLAAAKRLIAAQAAKVRDAPVRVDTPDAALRDWLKGCGLTHTTSEALMVRHDPAAPEAYRSYGRGAVTFALAAQAFG